MAIEVPALPAPTTAAEYQQAALADIEAGGGAEPTETDPQVTPSPVEAGANADGEPKPTEPKEAAPAPTSEEKPGEKPEDKKGFDALVREKAALRKREQELKAKEEKAARFEKAEQLIADGDYVGASALMNVPYNALVTQILKGKAKPEDNPKAAQEKPEDNSEVAQIRAELRAMKQERVKEQALSHVTQIMRDGGDKFALVAARGAEGEVLAELDRYYQETGELPSQDPIETLRIGLEAVEEKIAKEAEKWAPVLEILTKRRAPGNVASVASKDVAPSAASGGQARAASKTLTNSQVPVRTTPPEPNTPEEFRAALLAEIEG